VSSFTDWDWQARAAMMRLAVKSSRESTEKTMVRLSEICQRQAKSFPGYSGQAQSTFVVLTSRGALAHSPTDSYHLPPYFESLFNFGMGGQLIEAPLKSATVFSSRLLPSCTAILCCSSSG